MGGGGAGNLGGTNPNNYGGDFARPLTGQQYNQRLMQGQTNEQIRASQAGLFGNSGPSDAQFNDIVTQAGMQSPTGRPMIGSAQFYQPVYQPQYQDYNMGNPMSVSQYGQGFGGFNPYAMQMQTPFMQQAAPMPQMSPFRSSGPSQPIVTRSAGVRGTPNVMMRRAEGGIASLMDDE